MTREELMQKLTELGTVEDDAQRRLIITEVSDEIKGVYDSNETLTASKSKYEDDIKKLQEYNMQLFLKVGSPQKAKEKEVEEPEQTLKYENLFNEKGELK